MNLTDSEKTQFTFALIGDLIRLSAILALSVYVGAETKWYVGFATFVVLATVVNGLVKKSSE